MMVLLLVTAGVAAGGEYRARMTPAASALISLAWELVRGISELSSRFGAHGLVALIVYRYPLGWALVHGWKLLKECEAG